MRTQVGIVGGGPAGLVLARLLELEGIDTVVLEDRSRAYVEQRIRAGVLEHGTAELLDSAGVGGRMRSEGLVHRGIYLQVDGERHHVPMTELTGGRTLVVYGQQEVVKDLIVARLAAGLPLLFEAECLAVTDWAEHPVAHFRGPDGRTDHLECDLLVGADGFYSVCRRAVADRITVFEREYPFAWLGVLAEVAPSTDELIYARHERGFALHSLRSPALSRLYLQCRPDEPLEEWPDERIWAELQRRFASPGWTLQEGPILEKSVTPMRSYVAEPLGHGRLFLAGDAGHIVPPTGAKGLNLAVADAAVLAEAVTAFVRSGDYRGLAGYSDRVLGRVWRAQDFSNEMTLMMHSNADPFEDRRQRAHLRFVMRSRAAAQALAENYVGLPIR